MEHDPKGKELESLLNDSIQGSEQRIAWLQRVCARIDLDMAECLQAGPVDDDTAHEIRCTALREVV